MANPKITQTIEDLAAEIGENIYIDVAKWHLYLSDAHLHTPLAQQLYTLLEQNTLSKAAVMQIVGSITVKLGGGKVSIPLLQLIDEQSFNRLIELLEEYQKKL